MRRIVRSKTDGRVRDFDLRDHGGGGRGLTKFY